MASRALLELVESYLAHGGSVVRVVEGQMTVDWYDETPFRKSLREKGANGHKARRYGKEGRHGKA